MNSHLRRAAEKLTAADRRAFTKRVMWIDFEERLERVFHRFCPDQAASDPLGRLYLVLSIRNNPAYSKHGTLRAFSLNQAQISTGIRRLGLEHTLGETELFKTAEGIESGATISFSQNVAGTLSVLLFPYTSKLAKVKEENILLAFGLEPTSLTEERIERYLEIFSRYCTATSAHTFGGFWDYMFRLRLMVLDRRNRSVQSKTFLLALEKSTLVALAVLGVLATLYTSNKWPFAQ